MSLFVYPNAGKRCLFRTKRFARERPAIVINKDLALDTRKSQVELLRPMNARCSKTRSKQKKKSLLSYCFPGAVRTSRFVLKTRDDIAQRKLTKSRGFISFYERRAVYNSRLFFATILLLSVNFCFISFSTCRAKFITAFLIVRCPRQEWIYIDDARTGSSRMSAMHTIVCTFFDDSSFCRHSHAIRCFVIYVSKNCRAGCPISNASRRRYRFI